MLGDDGAPLAASLVIEEGVGAFVFPRLPPGRYRVVVAHVGRRFVAPALPIVDVLPGETTHLGRLTWVSSGTADVGPGAIRGAVTLEGGQGGARRVQLFRVEGDAPELVRAAVTAPDGTFALEGLGAGTYAVTAELDGFTPDYRVDLVVGEQVGAALVHELRAETGLVLHSVTAVLRPSVGAEVQEVEGERYTRGSSIPLELLAFGGVTEMRLSTSPDLTVAGVEAPFVPYLAATRLDLPAVEGRIPLYAQFRLRSPAGFEFVSPTFSTHVVRDTTPPEVLALTAPGLTAAADGTLYVRTVGAALPVDLDATDAQSALRGVWVGQPADNAAPDPAELPFDLVLSSGGLVRLSRVVGLSAGAGEKRIWAYVLDRAGNRSAPFALPVVVDDAAPAVASLRIDDGAAYATSSLVSLELALAAGADDAVELAFSTEQGFPVTLWEPLATTAAFLLSPGDGERSVWVKVRDAAGNVSEPVQATIEVDTAAPTAPTLIVAGGETVTNGRVVTLALSAQGAARARVSVDGRFDGSAAQELYSATFPTSATLPAGDSLKTVWAQFVDAAGNETQVVTASLVLDTAAPTFGSAAVRLNGGAEFAASVSVALSIDAAGASEMAIATDGEVDTEPFFPFATTATVLLAAGDCVAAEAGCKRVCVRLRDDAGNASDASCDAITLDTTAPSVPLIATPDSVVASTDFTFALAAEPTEAFFSHYEVFIQGRGSDFVAQPNARSALSFRVTLAAPPASGPPATLKATNLVRVRAVDRAGNVSAESARTVVVDVAPPATPLLAGLPNLIDGVSVVNADTIQLNFRSSNESDEDATFDHYEVRAPPLVPEFTRTAAVDSLIFTLVPDARTVLEVKAVDAAGNESGVATAVVREDSTEPSAPEISPLSSTVRATAIEVSLSVPSRDDAVPVSTYEVKGGAGSNFRPVRGNGPFLVALRPNRTNQVCLRGRDEAGNVSLEECAVVREQSVRPVIGNGIQVRAGDVHGDYLVYGVRESVFLHDLREPEPVTTDDDTQLGFGRGDLDGDGVRDPGVQEVHSQHFRVSGDLRVLRVAYGDGFRTNVVLWGLDSNVDVDPVAAGTQRRIERQLHGHFPEVSGNGLAYVHDGRVRFRRLDPLPPLVPDPNDLGTPISPADATLCPDIGPRLEGDVIVWCEWVDADADDTLDDGEGRLYRRVLSDASQRVELLSDGLAIERVGLFAASETARFQQPVLSERYVAWAEAEAGEVRLAVLSGGIAAPFDPANVSLHGPFTDPSCGEIGVDALEDLSAGRVALRFVRTDGLLDDVALFDFATNSARCVTNDLPPQNLLRIDGAKLIWRDAGVGESLLLSDLTRLRWVDASPELVFEPVTSRSAMAWIATRTDPRNPLVKRIALVGRQLPFDRLGASGEALHPEVELSSSAVFGGPSEADPAYAVGGTTIGWLEGTLAAFFSGAPLPLRLRDLATGATRTIPAVISTFALDPDGGSVAYVDGTGALRKSSTTGGLPGPVLDSGSAIPHVDLDGSVIVWQRGGEPDDRRSPGRLVVSVNGGAGVDLGRDARGPKVAQVGSDHWIAYFRSGSMEFGFQQVPHVCRLKLGPVSCGDDEAIGPGTGGVRDISISRDGIVAWTSDESGLDQIVTWDVRARRRVYATPVDPASGGRSAPDVAEGRLVWSDASLGNADVWEMLLPR